MKPDVNAVLGQLTLTLAQDFAPQASTPYLAGAMGISALVLAMATEEWDRAAHRRVEENRAIRAIFRGAEGLGLDAGLAARLSELATGEDADLRVSALDAANETLRTALIDLHAAVETRTDTAAQAVNAAIWAELAASTERRRFSMAPF